MGWGLGVQSLRAQLHLPPGWRLLAATGVDRASGSWASSWNLYAFFFVLITALAAQRLLGLRAGAADAGRRLVLLHGESDAPGIVWLSLLAALALRRVAEARLLRALASLWLGLSLVSLAWVAIPFLVDQVRGGLFPQVARAQGASLGDFLPRARAPQSMNEAPATPPPPAEAAPEQQAVERLKGLAYMDESKANAPAASRHYSSKASKAYRQDPHAVIQTGAGVPSWSWASHTLTWSGPVSADQRMRLVLLSPAVNLCWPCCACC